MRVFVVTAPSPIVTWADANARLRLDSDTTQQADVEAMIAAATGNLDGPQGWLGRCLGPQTLEARFDSFAGGGAIEDRHRPWRDRCWHSTYGYALQLPYPPIIDIVSVKYIDTNGVLQTLSGSAYELRGEVLWPVYGTSWPDTRVQTEAVRVQFRAGYSVNATDNPLVAAVPDPITAALLLMCGDLYSNRETTLDGRKNAAVEVPMSTTVEALLAPYRVAMVV